MNTPTRVPAGDPRGGQFTAAHRPESDTTLQRPGPTPSLRSPEHAELADLGVGQGILALLAPVEAKIVLAGAREKTPDREAVRNHVREYLHWRDRAETGPVHEPRARRILDEATRQHDAAWVGYAADGRVPRAMRTRRPSSARPSVTSPKP